MAETRFQCPFCGRVGSTTRVIPAGASVRCPGCQSSFKIVAAEVQNSARASKAIVVKEAAATTGERAVALTIEMPPRVEPVPEPLAPRPAWAPESKAAPKRKRKNRAGGKPGTIDRDAWIALGIGAVLVVGALAVPLVGMVIHVLMTVIHELGHTATAWLFASPALPSFDLTYGGGFSLITTRQPFLIIVAYAIFAFFLLQARTNRRELLGWTIAVAFYTGALFSPLREFLITAMGHGSELVFAGIFLHRALSGNQVLRSEERPLYAFLGLFMLVEDARFAYNLMSNEAYREAYGDAKGGGHWMDFDLIARDNLHWSLPSVAGLFLVACLLTPIATFLAHRYGDRLR